MPRQRITDNCFWLSREALIVGKGQEYIHNCAEFIRDVELRSQILIKYIKDPKTNRRKGVVLALRNESNNICVGFSLCNPRDRFCKFIGIRQAIDNAYADPFYHIGRRLKSLQLQNLVYDELMNMTDRSGRYFKKEEMAV